MNSGSLESLPDSHLVGHHTARLTFRASRMILARNANACAVLGRRTQFSSALRCSTVTDNGGMGRPVHLDTPLYIVRCERAANLFNELYRHDTSALTA